LKVRAPTCDPPCHSIVNTHLGIALALPDNAFPVQVIALVQGLFRTDRIQEVARVFRRNLTRCVVLVYRARGWARLGSSPGPTEASGSSVADVNVSMSVYQ